MIQPERQITVLNLILYLCLFLPFAVVGNSAPAYTSGSEAKEHSTYSSLQISKDFIRQYLSNEQEYRHHLELVQQFYKGRNYELAWFKNNKLIPQVDKLIEAIGHSDKEGLSHQKYKVKDLREMYRAYAALPASDKDKQQKQEELDVALTASYFNYASDFYKGAVDPHSAAGIEWEVKRNKIKLDKALEAILEEKENSPYYEFEAMHEGYVQLRNALVKYREIQENGGWEKIEGPKVVKLNDTAEVVLALRKRLLSQQQLPKQDTALMVYDEKVKDAVAKFQKRHGLLVDGILGPQTYGTLNVPVEERIEQLVLNMERWRWLPKDLSPDGDKHLLVNIPAYQVHVVENGQEVMQMKAVVGKTMHSTPIFSHKIQYLMFAPYWNVPNSIVANEIKPKMQQNRNWLASQNMEMVTTFGPNARRVPVSRVNWNTLTQENFRYRIRQRPGPNNSLGKVKFMFPNEYSVYLHDTPADHLFSEADRDFSHGCVRLEKPADLATYLLRNKPGWDRQRVVQAMNAGNEQRVNLPEEVPVYLVYFTAWVDEAGKVQFREDLYGHDKDLAQKLF